MELKINDFQTRQLRIILRINQTDHLRQKSPYSEFFLSVFSRIWTEYGEILCFYPYSVKMQEKTDQKNTEYGHFLRRDHLTNQWIYQQTAQRCIQNPVKNLRQKFLAKIVNGKSYYLFSEKASSQIIVCILNTPLGSSSSFPWTQDVNWTYIRRSEDVLDVF